MHESNKGTMVIILSYILTILLFNSYLQVILTLDFFSDATYY